MEVTWWQIRSRRTILAGHHRRRGDQRASQRSRPWVSALVAPPQRHDRRRVGAGSVPLPPRGLWHSRPGTKEAVRRPATGEIFLFNIGSPFVAINSVSKRRTAEPACGWRSITATVTTGVVRVDHGGWLRQPRSATPTVMVAIEPVAVPDGLLGVHPAPVGDLVLAGLLGLASRLRASLSPRAAAMDSHFRLPWGPEPISLRGPSGRAVRTAVWARGGRVRRRRASR